MSARVVGEPRRRARKEALQPESAEAFRRLVSEVQLLGVYLVRVDARLNAEAMPEDGGLELRMEPPQFRGQIDSSQRMMSCGTRLRASLNRPTGGDRASEVVSVLAEYSLQYRVPGDAPINQQAVRLFAANNAVFNAWPFFRELVQSVASRMNVPAVILPLVRLSPNPPSHRKRSQAR